MKTSPDQRTPAGEELSPREIGVATVVVEDFLKKHPFFRGFEFEDLLQECFLHWLARRSRYRRGRGASRATFMGKILRRRLLDILEAETSFKRRVNQIAQAIKKPPEGTMEGEPGARRQAEPSEITRLRLRLDLDEALAELKPEQARLCELLREGWKVSEISRATGRPRSTIHDELQRIREAFRERGLDQYL